MRKNQAITSNVLVFLQYYIFFHKVMKTDNLRVILPPNRLSARYTHARVQEHKNAQGHIGSWAFFYWVDMLIANTLRHTAIVSGAGSCVCVMVDPKGIEPSNLTDANRALSQLSYEPIAEFILTQIPPLVKCLTEKF